MPSGGSARALLSARRVRAAVQSALPPKRMAPRGLRVSTLFLFGNERSTEAIRLLARQRRALRRLRTSHRGAISRLDARARLAVPAPRIAMLQPELESALSSMGRTPPQTARRRRLVACHLMRCPRLLTYLRSSGASGASGRSWGWRRLDRRRWWHRSSLGTHRRSSEVGLVRSPSPFRYGARCVRLHLDRHLVAFASFA